MGSINRPLSGFLGRPSRRGDPLRAADLQELKDAVRRGRVAFDESFEVLDVAGGVLVRLALPPFAIAAKSGAGGVPAMSGLTPGTAQVTLYDFDGTTLSLSTTTVEAFNMASAAVGANKNIQLKRMYGAWFVDWEECP